MGRRGTRASHPRGLLGILGLALSLLVSCAPHPPKKEPAPTPAAAKTARITQFYARDPVLPLGDKTVLCYGVDAAKTVNLSPPADKVWPSFGRCIEIAPAKATTYTLTAAGEDGAPVSKSVTVEVGPALAKIIEVSVNSLTISAGQQVSVCYKVKNAKTVKIAPGHPLNLGLASADHGCAVDKPQKTTTYTVTAFNAIGATDTEHVTVKVR
jgi:hypothetical protein